MQICIFIEVGDDTDADELSDAIHSLAKVAALNVTTHGGLTVDQERDLATADIPAIWHASIFRQQ